MSQPSASDSQKIAGRIEDLYAKPLADLEALADLNPEGSMLAALISGLTDLQFAERNIAFQLQRLRELAHPERQIGSVEAVHILDCARRIADSVATRDVYAKTLSGVLASLHRVPAPAASPEPVPAAAPAAAPARAAARTR
ncbi:hypothetical protein QQY66_33955 [Streptomyces sp. DG2A-72]|uniref:hypothetical protein n=1 Tax=Streptomyces sp. DG2A-72 TaxID=3051386 RepID=UPI00265BBCE4|nr:hypothetical protein [Streptomyces sp. DG2A-72]MDO0936464.1 hypothetical protein [Streptomyces sp. DG2A-72]